MRNTTFNNKTFTWASIRAMRTIHETMSRVYQAAKELRGIEGPAEVARLLNESPQLINNWERRGVSSSGLLKIALTLGCRAAWLSTGEGSMIETATDHSAGVHPSGLARQLINRIAEADARGYLTKEVADLIN
jgi:phage repressor protein C with HTH and peptisase S24 domain